MPASDLDEIYKRFNDLAFFESLPESLWLPQRPNQSLVGRFLRRLLTQRHRSAVRRFDDFQTPKASGASRLGR